MHGPTTKHTPKEAGTAARIAAIQDVIDSITAAGSTAEWLGIQPKRARVVQDHGPTWAGVQDTSGT